MKTNPSSHKTWSLTQLISQPAFPKQNQDPLSMGMSFLSQRPRETGLFTLASLTQIPHSSIILCAEGEAHVQRNVNCFLLVSQEWKEGIMLIYLCSLVESPLSPFIRPLGGLIMSCIQHSG